MLKVTDLLGARRHQGIDLLQHPLIAPHGDPDLLQEMKQHMLIISTRHGGRHTLRTRGGETKRNAGA